MIFRVKVFVAISLFLFLLIIKYNFSQSNKYSSSVKGKKNIKPVKPVLDTNKLQFDFLVKSISSILKDEHYNPKAVDDSFSRFVFNEFIKRLDYEKMVFYQRDIDVLKKYEYKLDDFWNNRNSKTSSKRDYDFFYIIDSVYNMRMQENERIFDTLMNMKFNYYEPGFYIQNVDSLLFTNSYSEKKDRWKAYLKYFSIDRYYNEIESRNKNSHFDSAGKLVGNDTAFIVKDDSTIELEVRQKIKKSFAKRFKRYKERFSLKDKFNEFLNQSAEYFDPHTNYLPPQNKREFDESMSKRFFGIGALLREDDNGIKIEKVLPGGPAFKSQKVQPGDIILKVGQNGQNYIDIVGFDVVEAVRLIRGDDSTEVSLVLKHSTGLVETIHILRREIKTDEALVKSAIIKEGNNKIGFLSIPDFYSDFSSLGSSDGAKSFVDVATEIEKLKLENIDGLVIDLRNNGGGSLYDVVQIAGFFIFDGPVVQVKSRNGNVRVLNDDYKWVLYSGPITVMVNEFSASASEILAAAIQDYKRGLVVGSSSTYGKGTVQKTNKIELPDILKDTVSKDMGMLKFTIQKFYRINGNSTQLLGVVPDVAIPSRLQFAKIRERDNPNSMQYDKIGKADYKEWIYNNYNLEQIKHNSAKRISSNPYFVAINKNSKWMSDIQNSTRSLNYSDYAREEQIISHKNSEIDSIYSKLKDDTLFVDLMDVDRKKFDDEDKNKRNMEWAKSLRKDLYLKETVNIMKEMIGVREVDVYGTLK